MRKDGRILNLSDPALKKKVIDFLRCCDGLYWVEVRRCKGQRSLKQNAYYWGVVLPHLASGIADAWGETMSVEKAHEFAKDKFLKQPIVNHHTGEVMGHTEPTTTDLDTRGFAEYVDQIIKFAAEFLSTEIPEAKSYDTGRVAA